MPAVPPPLQVRSAGGAACAQPTDSHLGPLARPAETAAFLPPSAPPPHWLPLGSDLLGKIRKAPGSPHPRFLGAETLRSGGRLGDFFRLLPIRGLCSRVGCAYPCQTPRPHLPATLFRIAVSSLPSCSPLGATPRGFLLDLERCNPGVSRSGFPVTACRQGPLLPFGDLLCDLPPAATIHNAFPPAQLEALQPPPTAAAAAQTPLQGQGTPWDWGPRGRGALLLDTVAFSESHLSSCPLAQPPFSLTLTYLLGDVGGAGPPSGTWPFGTAQKPTPSMSMPHGDIIPNDFSSHNR